MSHILGVRGFTPEIKDDVFIAPNAAIIGNVKIEQGSSIWFNVTLRGDVNEIRIGQQVNIQDGSVVHGTYQEYGTYLEDRVTIGHLVMLHGCTVKKGSLIGMGSTLMDGVVIGEHCLVGAGSLVTEGSRFPARSLIMGRPAKVKRELTAEEVEKLEQSADNYLLYTSWYK